MTAAAGNPTAASAAVLDPRPARPHRPPPAAAPGRDRTLHHTCAAGPRRADPADRRTGSGAGLTRGLTVPTRQRDPGPWNRCPPERPRGNRHTPMPRSRPRGTRTPTAGHMIMAVKDPG